eukprot:11906391-Alexandrium_andersonii.AAC.1
MPGRPCSRPARALAVPCGGAGALGRRVTRSGWQPARRGCRGCRSVRRGRAPGWLVEPGQSAS